MGAADIELHATQLRAQMAEHLLTNGAVSTGLHHIFATVPRHHYVPILYLPRPRGEPKLGATDRIDASNPLPWLQAVYADRALLIQPAGGHSSTAPSLMGHMLQALAPVRGDRILEIGTCTGYNTAVLCELLGTADGHEQHSTITSIELNTAWAQAARDRLATASYHPTIVTGDGLYGYPANAPYDRILATCAVDRVPVSWLEQLRPGGRIVTPVAGGIATIINQGDRSAAGRFLPMPAHFMTLGTGHHSPAGLLRTARAAHTDEPDMSRAPTLPPAIYDHPDASFMLRLALPNLARARRDGNLILWGSDGSWARINDSSAQQGGPRRLWDEIETAYATWTNAHGPTRDRYGITITPTTQQVWLDTPSSEATWRLPGPDELSPSDG